MKTISLFCCIFLTSGGLVAQTLTQTIRGVVVDADTREALIGAEVLIPGTEPLIGTVTDVEGNFILPNVPVGRQTIQCRYTGYSPFQRDNIQLSSAKEYYIEIDLHSGLALEEVVVRAHESNESVNRDFVASVRRLDPEELQYHAATANDPSRLVMGLPGVQPSRDTRNDIIIRGNSAYGLLWRLEGIDILNPNHFARRGSSGGGITIFSASVLGSSDFATGAFPVEYGNVYSGVFDMRFRNGNMHRHEFSMRAGILGLDLGAEGPVGNGKSSYLANFRYSTLGILNAAGIHLVGPRTDNNFQDFSFKIHTKEKKWQWSIWGMGGNSRENYRAEDQPWKTYSDYETYNFVTRMGVLGFTSNYLINSKSYLQFHTGIMAQDVDVTEDTLSMDRVAFNVNDERYLTKQMTGHLVYKYNFNPKVSTKLGAMYTHANYDLFHAEWNRQGGKRDTIIFQRRPDAPSNSNNISQVYMQWNFKPHYKLEIITGFNALVSTLGKHNYGPAFHFAAKYIVNKNAQIAFHSGNNYKTQPPAFYYTKSYIDGAGYNIGSFQNVLAYTQALGRKYKLTTEVYFQYLDRILSKTESNSGRTEHFSFSNDVQGNGRNGMISTGDVRNYGVDVALERKFDRGTFFIVSGSLFDSKFKVNYYTGPSDWYNTRYNVGYTGTFTGGKTWKINNNTFFEVGLRMLFNGGAPVTPIVAGMETVDGPQPVLDHSRPFSERTSPYFRPDLRLAWRKNKVKNAWWLALDIQNFINRRNEDFIDYTFDRDQLRWQHRRQAPLTPILTFEWNF